MKDYREVTEMLENDYIFFMEWCKGEIVTTTLYNAAEIGKEVAEILSTLKDCRDELCERCGKYEEAHLGACDGCRWR